MRKLVTALIMCLLLTQTISFISCGTSVSSPESTIREAMKAVEALDIEKLESLWTQDAIAANDENLIALGLTMQYSWEDGITISNLKTDVISQTENSAIVKIEFDMESSSGSDGNRSNYHAEGNLELQNINSEWLLSGGDLFSFE